MAWGAWFAIVGGIVSIIGQFVTASNEAWLPLIGGVIALIGGIGMFSNK